MANQERWVDKIKEIGGKAKEMGGWVNRNA